MNKRSYLVSYLSIIISIILFAGFQSTVNKEADIQYVGSESCMECHIDIYNKWNKSSHSKGFRKPSAESILPDFNDKFMLSDPLNEIPETEFQLNDNSGNGPFSVSVEGKLFSVDYVHGGYSFNDKQRRCIGEQALGIGKAVLVWFETDRRVANVVVQDVRYSDGVCGGGAPDGHARIRLPIGVAAPVGWAGLCSG